MRRKLILALAGTALVATACASGGGASLPSTSAPASPIRPELAQSPAATPGAESSGGSEWTVEAICNRLVQSDAPAPPATPPTAEDPSSVNAWTRYFVTSAEFLRTISLEIQGTDFTSDLAPSIALDFSGLALGVEVQAASAGLEGSTRLESQVLAAAWIDIRERMAKMCPQWDADNWPFVAAPTVAVELTPPPVTQGAHERVSTREWRKIAKDPDGHTGEQIIVYGVITQFDSATGTMSFRANVEASQSSDWYDYETNTFLLGSEAQLEDFVVDDIFRARVTVDGALDYETTMGGTMTVPQLQIDSIKRIGSAD